MLAPVFSIRCIAARLSLAAVTVVLTALFPASPPAHAEFGYLGEWGTAGSGPGQFAQEADLATDADGDVYALDYGNHRVQKFDRDGHFITEWGSLGTAPGQFQQARHLAADASGRVYVADAGNSRVQVFSESGDFLRQWPTNGGTASIGVDQSGSSIYIGAWREVVRYDATGTVIGSWGGLGSGPGQFDQVTDVAVGDAGDVHVLDTSLVRVQKFTADGSYLSQFSVAEDTGRNMPALDVDESGNVFVVDAFRNTLRRFTSSGELTYHSPRCTGGGRASVAVGISGSVYTAVSGGVDRYGEGGTAAHPSCASSPSPPPAPATTTPGVDTAQAPPPPSGRVGVSINDGAQYTNDAEVTLRVVWPAGAHTALMANDGGFSEAHQKPVANRMAWRLDSSGPERLPRTVYVRFGASSQTFTDDIILDETQPRVLSANLLEGDGATTARSAAAGHHRLRIRAADSTSGVGRVQAAADKRRPSAAVRYRKRVVIRTSKRPRLVRVRDRAGNWSSWRRIR